MLSHFGLLTIEGLKVNVCLGHRENAATSWTWCSRQTIINTFNNLSFPVTPLKELETVEKIN